MNKAAREHLLWCLKSEGMWSADYRWSKIRRDEVARRFRRGGAYFFAWWKRVGHRPSLKPKRGQKR